MGIPLTPAVIERLVAGNLGAAVAAAARRLSASGMRPRLEQAVGDVRFARRLAASFAFPVSAATYAYLLDSVTAASSDVTTTRHSFEETAPNVD